jgi:polysaccharide pyruvyl transferase WcaK-like protein
MFSVLLRRIRHRGCFLGYIGWVGKGNLGDEAMFEAIKILMPQYDIEIFSGARKERILSKLGASGKKRFKTIVLGGGTLINQGYLRLVEVALSMGAAMHTLGTGVGSNGFSGKSGLELDGWPALLRQFKSVGVRGPHSQKNLEENGVANAETIGDLALALTLDVPQLNPANKFYILNVALPKKDDPDFPSAKLVEALRETVGDLKAAGYSPIPVAFCEEDIEPTKLVAAVAEQRNILINLPKTHLDYFDLLENAEFVVGVRLHSAVLSCCAGVPPILIGYRDKCADFMESMGLMEWHCDAFAMESGELSRLAKKMALTNDDYFRSDIHRKSLVWKECLMRYSKAI